MRLPLLTASARGHIARWVGCGTAARRVHFSPVIVACLSNIGVLMFERGELQRAVELLTESTEQAQATADFHGAAATRYNLALVQMLRGETTAALELVRTVLKSDEEMQNRVGVLYDLEAMASLYL